MREADGGSPEWSDPGSESLRRNLGDTRGNHDGDARHCWLAATGLQHTQLKQRATASVRLLTPSRSKTFSRCLRTVCGDTTS
jgi:hypothetical protein